jgi:phosphopantothenoylcysteine decarboxylase/phosphopantothenate--cysteine ligase
MKYLITAGPTREPLDPVRYLSNRSSGKMGYAIARAALAAGNEVILISGPVALEAPAGARLIRVLTSDEMFAEVHRWVGEADVCVLCAAVADFRPMQVEPRKIKKQGAARMTLTLEPTRDILLSLREVVRAGRPLTVGFAAETDALLENARRKLREKGCALLAVNDVSQDGIGFESDENELTLLFAGGAERVLKRARKDVLAAELIKIIGQLYKY